MSHLPSSRQQHHPDHSHHHHQPPYPIPPTHHPLLQPTPPLPASSSSSSSSYHLQQQQHTSPELPKPPKKSGSRSAVACNLCRAQKMKCEGPSCQPCKRCQRLKQPCVFGESQGRGRQIVWAKRTEELEARVSKLEQELSETKARVCRVEACVANLQTTSKQQPRKRKPSTETQVQDDPQPSQSARSSMVEGPPTSKAIQAAQFGPRRSDLIERGMLSPEMARRLFEIHQTRWAPQIPWLNIPDTFENVRWHSPLMLAVACSAGAKGDGDVDTYQKMKAHAIELILDYWNSLEVVFYRVFAHDRPQSYQDLIAVIGCIIHCGLYIDPVLVVDHAEYLRLRDVFDRIPEPRWQSEFDQRQLLSVARTFIGVYIHSVLYSTLTGKPCVMRIKKSILISYCSIICNSPYSVPEWDGNLVYFVKYYAIMQEAQEHLDSHYRLGSIKIPERLAVVEKYAALVNHWKQDLDRANHHLLPDAASEFKHLYHRAFAYLTCFVTQDLRTGKSLRTNKQGLRFAKEGVAHALQVLKQFIDSRKAERGVPCVHLEYRKSTISIATACILEGCVLIPEHIDFDHCREIIKTFALEVEAEGGGWGIGTEDKYVTTLKALLKDLDSRPSPQSAITAQNELELEDSIPEPGPPSVGTNEVTSSLPSPLEVTSSTGFPGPSSALENHELINDTASHGSIPHDTSQSGQLYGDGLSENTQLWATMMNMPIRSETPPTSLISYAHSLPSLSHDPMGGLKMAWMEDQKSYNSLDYEPSVQMGERGSKVGFPGEEQQHPHGRVDGPSACWKAESSQLPYPHSSSISYPEESRMDPETDDGERRQIFEQAAAISIPSLLHNPHHFHPLPQDGTDSASSFTHSNLSSFTVNHSQSEGVPSFLIHQPHTPHHVPDETFDLIQSLRTVYPDRMVQTTFQKKS